jgi:hypothetical protein
VTDADGEVIVLDSAGYGPVSITKSVSIIAPPGIYAGISVFSENGIDISAGVNDVVILRGLSVNGLGGSVGINFNSGKALYVENCVVGGFTYCGISFHNAGQLFVKETDVRENGSTGIQIYTSSGSATGVLDRVHLKNSFQGLGIGPNTSVTIRDSTVAGNSYAGISVSPSLPGNGEASVDNCTMKGNGIGIIANAAASGALIRVSNSTVTKNGTGWSAVSGGIILSRGNNTVEGNTTNGSVGAFSPK